MYFWFPFTLGLPYGWEEAYTADGIKYFIK